MKSNVTILTIVVALLGPATLRAQQAYGPGDYLSVATPTESGDTAYSSYIGDLDLAATAPAEPAVAELSELSEIAETAVAPACGESDCDWWTPMGPACGTGCCCPSCRREMLARRAFGGLEFMHWYSKGRHLPPLVTTSPQGTPAADAGVLGLPTTSILFGDKDVGSERQNGGRVTLGMWTDDCGERAIVSRVFGVEGRSTLFAASSDGDPILTRPFFNDDPLVNAQDSLLVAVPGVSQGNLGIRNEHEVFGADVFLRTLLDAGCNYRLDLVGGYRYNRIDDDLLITTFLDSGANIFEFLDLFDVNNEFHAGDLGFLGEFYRGCWTLSVLGKVGLGNMKQEAAISGVNTVTGGGSVTTPGGLLTQPTNIGVFERDVLVWAPEAVMKLNYAFSDHLSVSVGYSFMYWTRVSFSGDLVDLNVNATQLNGGVLLGPQTPAFAWRDTDYWVQTVDVGVSWNY